jgi:hypothetical protein
MTERSTFDAFEQRIAGELERYVAPAADPKSATEIAQVAMRPRSLVVRVRNVSRPRRYFLLGLAAALLVPVAYIGAISFRPPAPDPTQVPPFDYVSIFVRRDDGPEPGVSIFAVRPDGGEALVRKVPDSIAGRLSVWGTVSGSGWLALGVETRPWPMILVDLGDEQAKPWVVTQASTGGIGPRWGPTGLVAADAGSTGGSVVIADPGTHTTRIISMGGGLVGGGPSIVWSADGSGIVGSTGSGAFEVVPIDGGDPRPGVGQVFDTRGDWGPGLSQLNICSPGTRCIGGDDGRVERVEANGSVRTIWQQEGGDRALAASFGDDEGEYWLSIDHDNGRQVALAHVQDGRQDPVKMLNRDASWQYVGAPVVAPDQSVLLVWVDIGARPAGVLVPLDGAPPTFHTGQFAGFVDSAASAIFATGRYGAPAETLPAAGEAYALPSLDELIAAELGLNPGRTVLGEASRDGVEGETAVRTFEVPGDPPGVGDVYLDCVGPASVTVTSGVHSTTSPCLRAGSYIFTIDEGGPVIVTASGDTSWRVVIYSSP